MSIYTDFQKFQKLWVYIHVYILVNPCRLGTTVARIRFLGVSLQYRCPSCTWRSLEILNPGGRARTVTVTHIMNADSLSQLFVKLTLVSEFN